jgi:hypothetical protein
LFLPIRIFLSYNDGEFEFRISAAFYKSKNLFSGKMKRKNKKEKVEAEDKKSESDDFNRLEKFFMLLQAFYETSANIRRSICVEKLTIKAEFGSLDAGFTGMVTGVAYAEIYKLIGFLATIFTLEQPSITITPIFEEKSFFSIYSEGIIKTKAVHIIFTAIKFYREYKKAMKRKD